jgi:hypothetical protein
MGKGNAKLGNRFPRHPGRMHCRKKIRLVAYKSDEYIVRFVFVKLHGIL